MWPVIEKVYVEGTQNPSAERIPRKFNQTVIFVQVNVRRDKRTPQKETSSNSKFQKMYSFSNSSDTLWFSRDIKINMRYRSSIEQRPESRAKEL